MEENFRLVLIVISAVIIGAILIHGLWTIRKNKNPYKLKASNEKVVPEKREFDSSGFDQTGVSEPKVVGNNQANNAKPPVAEPQLSASAIDESIANPDALADPTVTSATNESTLTSELKAEVAQDQRNIDVQIEVDDEKLMADPLSAEVVNEALEGINKNYASENKFDSPQSSQVLDEPIPDFFAKDEVQEAHQQSEPHIGHQEVVEQHTEPQAVENDAIQQRKEPSFTFTELEDEPVKNIEPSISVIEASAIEEPQQVITETEPTAEQETKAAKRGRGRKSNDNQIGFDFDDEPKAKVDLEPEVIAISVTMPEGQYMSGAALLPSLLTLGLRFGDMDIFHRHQDNAGNGAVTFSLANMLKPGTFDLDRMETFATKGVTLFMTLPNEGDAFEVFEQLLSSAKHLAKEFNGQLLDSQRSVMTKQTEQHYLTRIREFERKARIAGF